MIFINEEKMIKNSSEQRTVLWIEILASLACLIGIGGLIALVSEGAWAADNAARGGFQPSNKTFTNPFANTGNAGGGTSPYFDDEDDDIDFPEDRNAQSAGSGSGATPVASNAAPTNSNSGVSLGGGASGGVVTHSKVPSLSINDETGEGSKEVVTDFNFPDADIMDIAKTLGRLTGKNFILDKDVKGRITIISNSPITVGDAWRAFLTALDINGFALIPSGKYIRIARQRDARDKQLKTYTGDFSPDTDALITRVFPLRYINAEEVARTFRSFMPANSRIIPYEQTNTVIVTDTGSNIAKLNKMLELLDIEGYDAGIEVIAVKYASAAELSKLIDTLIPGTGSAPGQPPGIAHFGGGGGGRFNARRTKEGGIINTILADERTNTLIVHANGKGADQVRELVSKLDQKVPAAVGGGKVHVIYLQFAEAEAIANTLNNFSQQSSTGFKPVTPGGAGTGVNPVANSLFEGSIKVSADKATNALVITASPADFVTVQRVINRLDIPRDEVYVEVVIMEVALTRGSGFSTNIVNPASGIYSITNLTDAQSLLNPFTSNGGILPFGAGGMSSLNIPGANGTTQSIPIASITGLVKALQTYSNGNVLATPQIIALDNTEANFESTEKIPVPTVTAIQGSTSSSFTKENVSLSIKIKPQINKMSNFVKMAVTAKLADINNNGVPKALLDQAFATVERTAQTEVVVGDADTIVLGGLTRDNATETVTKIPILGDIPLLGWLFKSRTTNSQKSNLLIFITPHIVRQYEKIRAVLDRKLKERDDFIEKNANGIDPVRETRDNMIRSLPDMKDIIGKKPESTVTIDEDKQQDNSNSSNGVPFTGESKDALPAKGKPGATLEVPPISNQKRAGNESPLAPAIAAPPTPPEANGG